MNKISQEYVGAIVLIITGLLGAFKINVGNDVVTGIVTGVVALWIAYRRYQKGDITVGGLRK